MRPIVLGNQRLLVNIDEHGFVRDLYYKRVGQENHVLGTPHRIGVWAENRLSWLDEPGWRVTITASGTLATRTTIRHDERDITLTFEDIVLHDTDVLIRRIRSNRHVRLFIYHYFFLYGDGIGDTAGYDPERQMLFHYKRNRFFGINAFDGAKSVLADYTVSEPHHEKDAWRDALDGILTKNPIAQGNVDSCVAFNVLQDQVVDYVVCCAKRLTALRELHDSIRAADRSARMAASTDVERAYSTVPAQLAALKHEWQEVYRASVLLVRAHADQEGAIVAGADSENVLFNRDTYTYAWGRDNAIIARSMDLAGKRELTRAYFEFMRGIVEPEGYYMHKHHPDGSLGSSWQAFVRDGKPYLPIQEDETALQLWALRTHHELCGDDYVPRLYDEWIRVMIDFLLRHMRDDVPLPKDSWDLWEERQGIHTWTVAAVIAGLEAGAFFANLHDDTTRATSCTDLAERLRESLLTMLVKRDEGRFIRRLSPELAPDTTVDAADLAPFLFGVLAAEHPIVAGTIATVERVLRTPEGGIARYERDYFHRKTDDAPGNSWTICTLWVANWHIARGNWERADELIDLVVRHTKGSHLLGEQFHPLTGEPLAVCPLTWSHAEFINTMHRYARARAR